MNDQTSRVLSVDSDIDRMRLHEVAERRRQLLEALAEKLRYIRAATEEPKLLHQVVRLAANLVGGTAAGLCLHFPQLQQLELKFSSGFAAEFIGSRLSHDDGLIGQVARTGAAVVRHAYCDWPDREPLLAPYNFKTVVGVPLKHAGEVEAVLFVAYSPSQQQFAEPDVEILQLFADQAGMALQTARVINPEYRTLHVLPILHQISDYIQAAGDLDKIIHVVLTGITAGYGLGFNRAALFLVDERQEALIGRMGIGHLDEVTALEDWERQDRNSLEDFRGYLERLAQGTLERTPVDEKIQGLRLPLNGEVPEIFSQTVTAGRPVLVSQEDELGALPVAFRDAFQPAVPLVVAPLKVRDRVIGLLVTDNKFIKSPVTPGDVESLLTFANTAAIAIDNAQLLHQTEVAGKVRTAVALMGMASTASRHTIDNDAATIRDLVRFLRFELTAGGPVDKLQQRLDTIDALAKKIRETPTTVPLSTEEGVESVLINNLVRERVRQLVEDWDPNKLVQYQFYLAGEDHIVVRASAEWLKRALDLLIDNAVEAMAESVTKELVVTTHVKGNGVEISIRDTGKGIPTEVLPQLFHEPIKKPKGTRGMGMGLLQAQTIVQTYGGEIRIDSTSSAGTTMVIWLPLEV